jgi:hypothetical protein
MSNAMDRNVAKNAKNVQDKDYIDVFKVFLFFSRPSRLGVSNMLQFHFIVESWK